MKNHKTFALVTAIMCLFVATLASAGTTVVGFELGVATRSSVEDELKEAGLEFAPGAEMAFAHGKPIVVQGPAFGISGLTETCFAFDQEDKLGFVGMLMAPERFDHMDAILGGKYSFLERHSQEDGSRCAHYESEDAIIELIHDMGAPLQVIYLRKDVRDNAENVARQKAEAAAKKEAENF